MTSRNVRLEPHRVLLVDDNHFGNLARKAALQELGLAVETALSGEEAFEVFLRCPFDVVVTDFRMPGMSGTELISRIRESGHPTRTILLTAWSVLGFTEESTGADAVLWKCGKETEQLQRTVRQLLMRRANRKPVQSEERQRVAGVARSG